MEVDERKETRRLQRVYQHTNRIENEALTSWKQTTDTDKVFQHIRGDVGIYISGVLLLDKFGSLVAWLYRPKRFRNESLEWPQREMKEWRIVVINLSVYWFMYFNMYRNFSILVCSVLSCVFVLFVIKILPDSWHWEHSAEK